MSDDFWKARAAACRAAVVVAESHDRETARQTVMGLLDGFFAAFVMFDGLDGAIAHINQLAAASRVPPQAKSPKLSVVQGGKHEPSVA